MVILLRFLVVMHWRIPPDRTTKSLHRKENSGEEDDDGGDAGMMTIESPEATVRSTL